MRDYLAMMAGYNRWANRRLYARAAAMDDAAYRADGGAFFGSVHRTLNHLLVADRIWMRRFTGAGDAPNRLDAILFEDRAALAEARAAEDERIIAFVGGVSDATLAGPITYRTITNPAEITQPLAPALFHFFNHQTHHRGQVHALMTQLVDRDFAPPLDLLLYQRETGVGL
ncbi:MAG: damage-inducible protein DinB [Bauldia sp.]|nr:damage-inducible protein DinB [Bauldia sp.]